MVETIHNVQKNISTKIIYRNYQTQWLSLHVINIMLFFSLSYLFLLLTSISLFSPNRTNTERILQQASTRGLCTDVERM